MKIIYFFFFILFLNNVYGFGVSPGSFFIELENGQEIEKEFFIYNNAEDIRTFNVSSYGFFNFTDFILEIDENSEKEIKFLVRVPYETPEGMYSGRIYVKELNKDEGGVNLDALLGIKFEFLIKSNYTEEFEDNTFEQKLELKEMPENPNNTIGIEEELGFEIILFYILIELIILMCLYRIYKNRQPV